MRGKKARAIHRAARKLGSRPSEYGLRDQTLRNGNIKPKSEVRLLTGTYKQVVKELKRDGILLEYKTARSRHGNASDTR